MAHNLPGRRFFSHLSILTLGVLVAACSGGSDTSESPLESGGAGGAGGKGGAAGASAGQGGTAGSAGSGNLSGSAGASGGTAGKAGAAGSAGKAGSAGNAGSGGAGKGGSAGSAGKAGEAGSSGKGDAGSGGGKAGSAGEAGAGGESGAAGDGGEAGEGGAAGDAGAGGESGSSGQSAGGDAGAGGSDAGAGGEAGAGGDAGAAGSGGAPCELTDCGGACVDTQTDVNHCGSCDTVCSSNGALSTCEAGVCNVTCLGEFSDCDGDLTNGCEVKGACACTPGQVVDCYDGPEGTAGVGLCKGGTKTCQPDGNSFGACEGQVVPATEICDGSDADEDCDGKVNESGDSPSCVCTPGSQLTCYSGKFGTAGVGACKTGLKTCLPDGTGFGACEGEVVPAVETCAPGETADEDCDGQTNEAAADSVGCVCSPNAIQSCYDNGLDSPQLKTPNGLCVAGFSSCLPDGTGFGACQNQVLPTDEVCDANGVDEDCDGQSNESGVGCDCVPGAVDNNCFDGPANAVFGGNSVCKRGSRTCQPSGKWGACVGQVLPGFEPVGVCTANIDEDCDGNSQGPGAQDLDGDGWSACGGDCCETTEQCTAPKLVNPGAFDVAGNSLDDDCNGAVDDAVATCDNGLASNSGTGLDYAKAMDLCQTTTENDATKKWGVISATFSLANGAGTPDARARSIRPGFGSGGIVPKKGSSLAVLSTGGAADSNDLNPNYLDFQVGTDLGNSSAVPADWLAANGGQIPNAPGCPGPGANTAFNPIMLKLRVRVPTNAQSFSFNSFFMSSEFPEWVCTPYNDFFVALLDSSFAGQPANPADKNLAIYDAPPIGAPFFPVGVNLARLNNGLFQVCKNGTIGCSGSNTSTISTCSQGTGLLTGTGMDIVEGGCGTNNLTGGGTGYLTSSGNVKPGETIEVRFAIWDVGDGIYDSVVLLDNWTWSLNAAQPGTVISQ